ncbi:hypothetical protein SAMN05428948_2993 [Massilia sp. CF038]|nr:hypothetical protein SAMN05428948_2993 [Massilia sp. CF038]
MRIGVAPGALALAACARWGAAPTVLAELAIDSAAGAGALGASLRQLLADTGVRNWPASVIVGDELARLWQVQPPAGAARLSDLEGAAALRFQALYGEPASGWKMAAGWDAVHPFLAAALPLPLLTALEEGARAQQLTLVGITPQFVASYNRWRAALKSDAWFGQVHAGVLTLGASDGQRLQAVRAVALPEGASADWLAGHVAREALRLNLAQPARLQLAGPAPTAWHNSAGALACTLLDAAHGHDAKLSDAARLALTGIGA